MGVQADDELLLDIAAKQFASQEKQDREKKKKSLFKAEKLLYQQLLTIL